MTHRKSRNSMLHNAFAFHNLSNVSPTVSTDQLSEEILARDSQHIDSIELGAEESFSYFYQ